MKIRKPRHIELLVILLVFAALFASIFSGSQLSHTVRRPTLRELNEGWFRYVNGQKYHLTLPCKITVPPGENLVICNDSLQKDDGRKTVFTKGAVYNLRMQVDGRTIYAYEDHGFKRNAQMKSKLDCMGILPDILENSRLTLILQNQGSDSFYLKPVYIGRSGETLRKLWYNDIFSTIGIFAMSVISVICICGHLYLRYLKIHDSRMASAAMFLVLCSSWCMLESSLAQQVPGAADNMSLIAIFSFMCLPIPVIHFVKSTGEMRKYRAINGFLWLTYGNVLLQSLLHFGAGVHYSDMVPLTQLLHSLTCTCIHCMLFLEYRDNPNFEIKAVLQGFTILGASGVVELILYWGFRSSHYGLALELGVLAFIIRMLCAILSSMTANIRFKAEAMVYKTLSREDRLTGLGNRRAFDEMLEELEAHAYRYRDAAIFFMDVNGLKQINDSHGHNAGDELIINAARCISSAFSDVGTCYRLGGDEFACIVLEPSFTEQQWADRINTALNRQNAVSRWPLSIAWGVSYQRDPQRKVKNSSDWLYEADQTMYQMKTRMKATREEYSEVPS